MRLIVNLSENNTPVPFQHLSMVTSWLHDCLGRNNKYHDKFSNYSITLQGGREKDGALWFGDGGKMIVSSPYLDFLNTFVAGMSSCNEVFCGMKVVNFTFENTTFYNGWNYFMTLSPVLFDVSEDGVRKYRCLGDKNGKRVMNTTHEEMEDIICKNIKQKVSKHDPSLNVENIKVEIPKDKNFKVKQLLVKNIINYATSLRFNLKSSKHVAQVIYDMGVGQSTGVGFGCITTFENFKKIRYDE